jgi:hypothetical protein
MRDNGRRSSRWQVPFFSIWTGQAFSLVGSRVAQFALVWWLTKLMVPNEHLSRVAGLNQAVKGAVNIVGPHR